MPVADFLKVIDEIMPHINPNKVLVVFTGGEALVRRDLEEYGLALYERSFPWGMVTNGMLMSDSRFESLLKAGLRTMTVSLDGFEDEHNWMRGDQRSFRNAVEAIKLLASEKGVVWDVVTCANSKNFSMLSDFKEFLISIGVKKWRLFTVFPVGRAAQDPDMQLSDSAFVELMEFIKKSRAEGRIEVSYGCEGFLGKYEGEVRDSFYHCQAGVSVASVLADGSISACPSIRANFHQGNIYKDSFMDVWNNRFQKFRDRSWAKKGECAKCPSFKYCMGNGMHLRDENEDLLLCHLSRIERASS